MKDKIEDILNSYILDDLPSGMVSELSTLIQEERKEAYKKGRNDKEKELVRNVLLDGEPRHYIGLDSPNRTLSKKYAEYLESEGKE